MNEKDMKERSGNYCARIDHTPEKRHHKRSDLTMDSCAVT